MAGVFENRQVLMRIFIGIFVGLIAVSMLLYLVPQGPGAGAATTDTVATIGDQSVTLAEIQQQLAQIEQRGQFPKQLESLYARQILNQLLFEKEIEYEAKQQGVSVTNEETAEKIKQFLPTAFNGDNPVGMDQYAAQVQQRFQMTVPAFEAAVKKELLFEKFRKLVTDGISAGPAELKDQFNYQNEKVKLEYALIKPEELEAKITPDEAEIKAAYEKNKTRYQEPERRAVRYGLIDINRMRVMAQVSDDDLKQQYQQNVKEYQVPNRVHVAHILLFTRGKTDAEVTEIQKRAEEVLKEVKKGGKFEDLAKKYSEDTQTKEKGGDLGWLIQGQTVPAFEKAAFSTTAGSTSDVVKTEYGFHIIKVLERETAHIKPFEEVKNALALNARQNKGDNEAGALSDRLAAAIRKSNKVSLDDLAKEFHLDVQETAPVSATDPLLYFGKDQAVKEEIFRLRQGEVSLPIRTDRGYVVLTLKSLVPAHPGTLEEERTRVVADLKQEKAVQLAKAKAEELGKRVKGGEKFDAAAKALGVEAKTSDPIARAGSIPGVGSGKQLAPAFQMKQGEVAAPLGLGNNWVVYRVTEKTEPNPVEFETQKKALTEQVLQEKRGLAFEAFRTALEERLKKEGKLKLMPEKLKSFGDVS